VPLPVAVSMPISGPVRVATHGGLPVDPCGASQALSGGQVRQGRPLDLTPPPPMESVVITHRYTASACHIHLVHLVLPLALLPVWMHLAAMVQAPSAPMEMRAHQILTGFPEVRRATKKRPRLHLAQPMPTAMLTRHGPLAAPWPLASRASCDQMRISRPERAFQARSRRWREVTLRKADSSAKQGQPHSALFLVTALILHSCAAFPFTPLTLHSVPLDRAPHAAIK
jgi:hypothetical protein